MWENGALRHIHLLSVDKGFYVSSVIPGAELLLPCERPIPAMSLGLSTSASVGACPQQHSPPPLLPHLILLQHPSLPCRDLERCTNLPTHDLEMNPSLQILQLPESSPPTHPHCLFWECRGQLCPQSQWVNVHPPRPPGGWC